MRDRKIKDEIPSQKADSSDVEETKPSTAEGSGIEEDTVIPWHTVIGEGTDEDIKNHLRGEVGKLTATINSDKNCLISLYHTNDSISSWDADRVFRALQDENADHKKDVLLFLVSSGGSIEPAYQISKICKGYANSTFKALVPRHAKSAATLIALGADEIHMGMMSELGPIDPQLGNLPALGVKRSLEIIASICHKYPNSSDVFAGYLGSKLTIEQIGYSDRVCESAVQYAVRLLEKKEKVSEHAGKIAYDLVYEYKDHGFVIDLEEARSHLGSSWIISESNEIGFAEKVYQLFNMVNLWLEILKGKRLLVVGSLLDGMMILDKKK